MRQRDRFINQPARRTLSWNAVVIAAGLAFVGIAVLVAARGGATVNDIATSGADFAADEALFADGKARFYTYTTAAGQTIRFFVMKSADGIVRAAMDACVVCYRKRLGYRQDGDQMVCNKCGQSFASTRINEVTGGCNPIPLDRQVAGGRVSIRAAALETNAVHY
jgi:uncharacterized membrane protein